MTPGAALCRRRDSNLDTQCFDAAAVPHASAAEPPLRRGGPLRGHTQHNRAGQSVLRGPHTPQRSNHYHHQPAPSTEAPAGERESFGSGL